MKSEIPARRGVTRCAAHQRARSRAGTPARIVSQRRARYARDIINITTERMSQFIHHALMLLEDAGMSVRYPDIHRITREADGTSSRLISRSGMQGRRVSIEQNPQMKFMMMFALLDAHVDATDPALEGLTYRQKYQRMPAADDAAMMLRELFRLAKLIRNTLVHHPSAFRLETGQLRISYLHKNTAFALTMSDMALRHFYTALQMILRGDLGTGNYFDGTMRSPGVRIVVASPEWSGPYRGRAREIVWDSIQQNEKKRCCGR